MLIPEHRSLALFRPMRMGWVQRTCEQGPGSTVTVQIFKFQTCPLNPLTLHSTTQWGEECLGVHSVPLVSVLQTRSSQKFVFKVEWKSYKQTWVHVLNKIFDRKVTLPISIKFLLSITRLSLHFGTAISVSNHVLFSNGCTCKSHERFLVEFWTIFSPSIALVYMLSFSGGYTDFWA